MTASLAVHPLTAPLVPATADLLAQAFEVDSAYRAMFPGGDRAEGLRDLFARNLAVHLPYGATWVGTGPTGELLATLTVRPPGGIPLGAWTMLRHGAVPFVRARGLGAMRRMLWLKRTYDALEQETAGGVPHWHLHMMAVAPQVQGQGVGTRVLHEVLGRTVATDRSRPTVLATHLERNVVFYRRAGFSVVQRREIAPPGVAPYPVWLMRD